MQALEMHAVDSCSPAQLHCGLGAVVPPPCQSCSLSYNDHPSNRMPPFSLSAGPIVGSGIVNSAKLPLKRAILELPSRETLHSSILFARPMEAEFFQNLNSAPISIQQLAWTRKYP